MKSATVLVPLSIINFLFFHLSVHAEESSPQNCSIDLVVGFPDDGDWNDAYLIQGDDGSIWQRSLLSLKSEILTIEEAVTTYIEGTGHPNSSFQMFLFSPQYDGQRLLKPDPSLCFEWGETSMGGFFRFPVNAQMIWGNIGDTLVFDVYTRMDEDAGLYFSGDNDTQNFFLGSGFRAREVQIDIDSIYQKGCDVFCEEAGLMESRYLDPASAEAHIVGQVFDPIASCSVSIGRAPGKHTYYSKIDDENCTDTATLSDPYELQKIAYGTTLFEVLKRMLLGHSNFGGMSPSGLSVGFTPRDLTQAEEEIESASEKTVLLLWTVKKLLTDMTYDDKNVLLENLNSLIPYLTKEQHEKFTLPIFSYPYGIGFDPGEDPNAEAKKWAEDFIDLILFWTGTITPNTCIIENDARMKRTFGHMKNNDPQVGSFTPNNNFFCEYVFVQGADPMILIHREGDYSLQPSFTDTKILTVNRPFDTKEEWFFSEEDEKILRYGFEFTSEFSPPVIADYCTDRRSLVDRISADLSLLPKEKELIDREFDYFGVRSDTPIRFSVVDPVDISTRFDWTVDEERIDLLQLFFLIDQSGCEEENTSSMPSLPISLFPSQRDAFEVGILP